jgi:transposase-like protein
LENCKIVVKTALNAELTDYLGSEKHQNKPEAGANALNGSIKKLLKGNW